MSNEHQSAIVKGLISVAGVLLITVILSLIGMWRTDTTQRIEIQHLEREINSVIEYHDKDIDLLRKDITIIKQDVKDILEKI